VALTATIATTSSIAATEEPPTSVMPPSAYYSTNKYAENSDHGPHDATEAGKESEECTNSNEYGDTCSADNCCGPPEIVIHENAP
jgi:hypothetical protein